MKSAQTANNAPAVNNAGRVAKPGRRDWGRARRTLHSFKGVSRVKRAGIWLRGYIDGKRGVVTVSPDGLVTSPYCSQMQQEANRKVDAEWLNCDGDVNELRPFLDQQAHEYDGLMSELAGNSARREAAAKAASGQRYEGDEHIPESTVERRRSNRVAKATASIDARRSKIVERLDEIQSESAEPLADYEEREAIAASHELVITHVLAEKTAVYVRGASRHLPVTPGEVRALVPTDIPRESHYERYRRYDFGAHSAVGGA